MAGTEIIVIAAATIAGPILAVQAQKWIERAGERRRQKIAIFSTIMANRATRVSDDNVKALNAIDLAFRAGRIPSNKDRAVREAWHSLFGELTQGLVGVDESNQDNVNRWNERVSEFYVQLERAMAKALGYTFTDEQLRRGIYYPRGHNEREQAQLAILHNLKLLLGGETAINMRVKELPVTAEAAATQEALQRKLMAAYADDGSLKITVVNDGAATNK
jgi:hypothetical protein